MRIGLLVMLVACSDSTYKPPPPPPDPPPLEQLTSALASDPPDVFFAATALKNAGSNAGTATDALLAAWPRIEAQELVLAKRAGTERAQGKSRDNCRECTIFGETMDALAPHESRLATAWNALKPKLVAAEQAAYDAEASDKRPRVIVWATVSDRQADASMVVDCTVAALQARYPDTHWLTAWQAPAPGTPSVEVLASITTDDYVDSQTHQHATSLASGLKVALVPHQFAAIQGPIKVAATVSSPDEIRSDLNVKPTLEATRAGMDQLDDLRKQACTKIASALR